MTTSTFIAAPRPREKLLMQGAAGLSDLELVALFLGSGARGYSSLTVADTLLRRAGSLRALLLTQAGQAMRMPGMGPARYSRFQSALELARRVRRHTNDTQKPGSNVSPASTRQSALRHLADAVVDLSFQGFAVAFYGPHEECLACERFFRGTLEHVYVHPREVVRRALALRASFVAVARGDAEGTPRPTRADQCTRSQLASALTFVDVELRTYHVVGQSGLAVALGEASEFHALDDDGPVQLPLDLGPEVAERQQSRYPRSTANHSHSHHFLGTSRCFAPSPDSLFS